MTSAHRGSSLPKFGEWDEKNPAAADGFTVIFERARDNKKNGGAPNDMTIPQENQNQNQNQFQNNKHEPAKKNDKHKYPGEKKTWHCCFR